MPTTRLLSSCLKDRRAKLRTVLCAIVKTMIFSRARVQSGREQIMAAIGLDLLAENSDRQSCLDEDCFRELLSRQIPSGEFDERGERTAKATLLPGLKVRPDRE
jgi:hypothetical protein